MHFDLSAEQTLLQESASRFLTDTYDIAARTAAIGTPRGYSSDMWRRFADFGWLGLPLSEDVGGFGGGAIDVMILMECLGGALVVEPYLGAIVLAGRLLDRTGSPAQRQRVLPDLIRGEKTLALAHAEPQARYDLASVRTTAVTDGDTFCINGTKTMVLNGAADALLVLARCHGAENDPAGLSLFLVDASERISVHAYRTVDGMRAADLVFDDVVVDGSALVGDLGQAFAAVDEAVTFASLAVAAESVGVMEAANRTTIDYLKMREQFSVKLATFQALQHRVVDMTMAAELARSLVIAAAIKMHEQAMDRTRAVAAAKYECGKAGRFIGKNAVQLHGGMGMSHDYIVGHYLKRLLTTDMLFGDQIHQCKRYERLSDSRLSSEAKRSGMDAAKIP